MDKLDILLRSYGLEIRTGEKNQPKKLIETIIKEKGYQEVTTVLQRMDQEQVGFEIVEQQQFIEKMKIEKELKKLPLEFLDVVYLDVLAFEDVYAGDFVTIRIRTDLADNQLRQMIRGDIEKRSEYYGVNTKELKLKELFGKDEQTENIIEREMAKVENFLLQSRNRSKWELFGKKIKKGISKMIEGNNRKMGI